MTLLMQKQRCVWGDIYESEEANGAALGFAICAAILGGSL